jgi:hypothetical protein
MDELGIPVAAQRDPQSWELMRAWVAENNLNMVLNIGVYEESGMLEEQAWGMILSDAARHDAAAISERFSRDEGEALRRIRDYLEAELDNPTTEARKDFDA